MVHRFEDMDVWQEARALTRAVRKICKKPSVKHDFAFVDQITRSVRSISANIAEGAEAATKPEFALFLSYAKRSAGEVRAHLYDALDEGYIDNAEFNQLLGECAMLGRKIGGFMRYLRKFS